MKKRGKNSSKSKNKKGQEIFGLSFGMIFAVILIIFFVIIAFIVINQWIHTSDCAKIGMFYNELNTKVKSAWDSGDITSRYKIDLPSQINAVCFSNLTHTFTGPNKVVGDEMATYDTDDNTFLYATKQTSCDFTSYYIEHLDLEKITATENPYCIGLSKGKGTLVVDMQNGEPWVTIKRE
jgi:hypothetical protein